MSTRFSVAGWSWDWGCWLCVRFKQQQSRELWLEQGREIVQWTETLIVMYFHTDKGRTTVVGFLLVCRCWAGKLEAGNGWRVSLTLSMVFFLGSGRETVVVDAICSCRGSKVGVFFFSPRNSEIKKHMQNPSMVVCSCNSSMWKAEAGCSPRVWGQPGYIICSRPAQAYKDCLKNIVV